MAKSAAELNWNTYFKTKPLLLELVLTLLFLIAVLSILARFLLFVEERSGVVLNDPLLALIPPQDLTWVIFLLIYGGLAAALTFLSKNPNHLVAALQTYIVMVVFRIIAMYLVPLEPPEGIIPLRDPLVEIFGTGQLLNKDLFFSGHTATMFIFFLTSEHRILRILFLSAAAFIAVLVIIQHVHYTIDVLAAPFFTYCSYSIVVTIHRKFRNK